MSEPTQQDPSATDQLGLEPRLVRLEAIVRELEGSNLELDDALRLFAEGVEHLRTAEALLEDAEIKVEELIGAAAEGRTQPLDLGES